jgi:hypothetical protein
MSLLPGRNRYTNISTESGDGLVDKEFDPYEQYGGHSASHHDGYHGSDSEEGYGGGAWTMHQFRAREKDRLSTIGERSEYDHESLISNNRDRMSPPPRTITPGTMASRRPSPPSLAQAQDSMSTPRVSPLAPAHEAQTPPAYDPTTAQTSLVDQKTRLP